MIIKSPGPSHIPVLRRLWKQAFGDTDAFLDSFFSIAFSPNRCRCLYADGQLASVLYWFDCAFRDQKIAYLYAVATDSAYQNRGLCRALMEDTHRHLQALGYDAAMLVPVSKELFRFYEKLGYRTATYICEYTCNAAEVPACVRPIDAAEYALLRRSYLPEGSVIQEGPALALLQSQVNFYAGEDFLCIAGREDGGLRIAEFLGDPARAGGVICALNEPRATLRTPGNHNPFSMHLSLSENAIPLPSYFGLPLD